MRLPLGANLESRDGLLDKDAKVVNALIESEGGVLKVRKRPGVADLGLINAGQAQFVTSWLGLRTLIADTINGSIALSPDSEDLPFTFQPTGNSAATPRLMFKNRTQGWTMTRDFTVTEITYGSTMGTNTYSVTSLTRSGTVATAVTASDTGLSVGDSVTIAGATPSAYNGAQVVTGVVPGSSTPARAIPITITRSGTTATATTVSGAHGLTTATAYTIAGANESAYNGSFTITVTSSTTFTFTVTETAMTSPATGSPAHAAITATTITGSNFAGTDRTKFVLNYTPSTGTLAGNGIAVGSQITITGNSIGFNGTYTVAAVAIAAGYLLVTITIPSMTGFVSGSFGNATPVLPAVSSITYSGSTATVTAASAHNLSTGNVLTVSGCAQGGYNKTAAVTVTGTNTYTYAITATTSPSSPATGTITVTDPAVSTSAGFTFTIGGSPATPATGTITAQTVGGTVPGIPYINGYFAVMDVNGNIWNSALDDPTSWGALDFVTAQNEPGRGVALAKSQNYLIAFKENSSEFFYDAKNATGSPFSPVENGFTLVGCACGDSVASMDGLLLWVAQSKGDKGRSVYMMSGLEQQKISTPSIDRILNADDLRTVYAFCAKVDGHTLYILTLTDTGITLVYDFAEKVWMQWSSLTISSSKAVESVTRTGSIATVITTADHGFADGDPVGISGADQSEYNGIFQISYIAPRIFTIEVNGEPPAGTGTILAYPYTESYFKFVKYANHEGNDVLLHETDGHLYMVYPGYYLDDEFPIDFFIRTTRIDGGSSRLKKMGQIGLACDRLADSVMLRTSNDDSQSFTSYRRIDMETDPPTLRRLGSFRRRSFEIRYTGYKAARLEALEIGD